MATTITRHPMKKSFGPSLSISFAMGISPTDIQQVNWDPDQSELPRRGQGGSPGQHLPPEWASSTLANLWLTQIPRLIPYSMRPNNQSPTQAWGLRGTSVCYPHRSPALRVFPLGRLWQPGQFSRERPWVLVRSQFISLARNSAL